MKDFLMSNEQPQAKVFISCGQRKLTDEFEIAEKIADELIGLHYKPYIATTNQTLSGIKESIFPELESSDYFLFIDFKREQLDNGKLCRGSLFSHQELAVASYLDKEVIAFQEEGVKQRDGLMGVLLSNTIPFSDRQQLPNLVAAEVDRRWRPNWKNQLVLVREADEHTDVPTWRENPQTGMSELSTRRFFHITVKNLNPRKMAINCYIYLEKVQQLAETGKIEIPIKTIEFKWEGYILPNAVIAAGQARSFDAFHVFKDDLRRIRFQTFSDSETVIPKITGAGDFLLTYGVVSENFAHAAQTFQLHISDQIDDIRFQQLSN
jgi:hypothetical protein